MSIKRGRLVLCLYFAVLFVAGGFGSECGVLWQIGKQDDSGAEFALGEGDFRDFSTAFPYDTCYVTSYSKPGKDLPYVLPGRGDSWAGRRPHKFKIVFALNRAPSDGMFTFLIDLVDTHYVHPPLIEVDINNHTYKYQTPEGANNSTINGNFSAGREHIVKIKAGADRFKAGNNVISIKNAKGCWMLFDMIALEGPAALEVTEVSSETEILRSQVPPVLVEEDGDLWQQVTVAVSHTGEPVNAEIVVDDRYKTSCELVPGFQKIHGGFPRVDKAKDIDVELKVKNQILPVQSIRANPVREWEVHLLHQTHLDIGYTHTQPEVLNLQVNHLYNALEMIESSGDLPAEAGFKWHPDGMWAVEEFLRTASEQDKAELVKAAKNGKVHFNPLYVQPLPAGYTEEELFELIGRAVRYSGKYDVPVDSAMQTDVPGCTEGLITALAHHGVKYLNTAPNRLGHIYDLGDRPFYWRSPSGKHKILFWMASKGYAMFHGKPSGHNLAIDSGKVFRFLEELEQESYPYKLAMIRYAIGADNGPPNPALSSAVMQWNKKYAYPKLVLSNVDDVMAEMERLYGNELPVFEGDLTPYWEDGMASTAKDTGISRRACERLVQVQNLSVMLDSDLTGEDFDRAWQKLIMYDEHTWGAINSTSEPNSPFVTRQAKFKHKYALDGKRLTEELFEKAVAENKKADSQYVDVYNTLNWARSGLVFLSPEQSEAGDRVVDISGTPAACQRLESGELVFRAEDVPAFGARRFIIKEGEPAKIENAVQVEGNIIKNASISVEINETTGAVSSLKKSGIENELVDSSKGYGLNDYLYIRGRDPSKNNMRIESPVRISVVDDGPLLAKVKIESSAPGANKLTRTVQVSAYSDMVEILNVVDKFRQLKPEGVYFNFPFNVPGGEMKIDSAWSVFTPEKDQLPGANKNFFCLQRFVDISNNDYGITWMSIDAPVVQWDPIRLPPFGAAENKFRRHISPDQTIHSWVMNNLWETNYKPYQEGVVPFRYVLFVHSQPWDPVKTQKVSREVFQPLIPVSSDPRKGVVDGRLKVEGKGIVVTTLKPTRSGDDALVRIFNTDNTKSKASIRAGDNSIWLSNPAEDKTEIIDKPIEMLPYEIVTLRIGI